MDNHRAMRVLTRKGQMLDGNTNRRPRDFDKLNAAMPRTKDDFEVVYHSDHLEAIRELPAAHLAPEGPYLNDEVMGQLEAGQLFPAQDRWEDTNDNNKIPLSRFSPYEDAPPQKTGVFRSLSKKVAGALFRSGSSRRPKISAPLRDMRHEPDGQAGLPSAVRYAVPIENPAAELTNRADTVEEAIEMQQLSANGQRPKLTEAALQQYQQKINPQPEGATKRKVKVVGGSDHSTEFGDFMNLRKSVSDDYACSEEAYAKQDKILRARANRSNSPAPSFESVPLSPDRVTELGDFIDDAEAGAEDVVEDDDSYDQERRILQTRRLHSFRLSRDSWMNPDFPAQSAFDSPQPMGLGISMPTPKDGDLGNGLRQDERDVPLSPPARKPSKRVDISKHSWVPPTRSEANVQRAYVEDAIPMRSCNPPVESLVRRWDQDMDPMDSQDSLVPAPLFASRMKASNNPTTESRKGRWDQNMDPMDSQDSLVPKPLFFGRHRPSANQERRPNSLDMVEHRPDDDEEDREIMVDTYIQGNQVLWAAGERDGEKTTRKEKVEFLQNRTARRAENAVDEAALLMKRLESLKTPDSDQA